MNVALLFTLATATACGFSWLAAHIAIRAEVRSQSALRETRGLFELTAERARLAGVPKNQIDGPYRSLPKLPEPRPTLEEYLHYKNALEAIAVLGHESTGPRIAKQALGEKP